MIQFSSMPCEMSLNDVDQINHAMNKKLFFHEINKSIFTSTSSFFEYNTVEKLFQIPDKEILPGEE